MTPFEPTDCPSIDAGRARMRCPCGHGYTRDEHGQCPVCGSEGPCDVAADEAAGEGLSVSCDWVYVSRVTAPAGLGVLKVGTGEPPSEGHRTHLAESLEVRDTEFEIRRRAWPDPARVVDRASFLVFVAQLSARLAATGRADAAALLDRASQRAARVSHAAPSEPVTWRELASFLLGGTRTG